MTAVPGGVEIRIFCTASFDDLKELVRDLADDEEFRTQFAQEPRRHLRDRGIDVPEKAVPEPLELPPADVVRSVLGEMQAPDFASRARNRLGPLSWLTVLGGG